jgi:hypothetical protein
MQELLYGDGALPAFLFLTVALGGAAALTTGRAIARRWQGAWHIPLAMLGLALAVSFLHYALFNEPAIPLTKLGRAISSLAEEPWASLAAIADALRLLFVKFIILAGFASLGFALTRRRQMARQYHWLAEAHGAAASAD